MVKILPWRFRLCLGILEQESKICVSWLPGQEALSSEETSQSAETYCREILKQLIQCLCITINPTGQNIKSVWLNYWYLPRGNDKLKQNSGPNPKVGVKYLWTRGSQNRILIQIVIWLRKLSGQKAYNLLQGLILMCLLSFFPSIRNLCIFLLLYCVWPQEEQPRPSWKQPQFRISF